MISGHTLARFQAALEYIFNYGSDEDIAETGLSKVDLCNLKTEAVNILEFYAPEILQDAEFNKPMDLVRSSIPADPLFTEMLSSLLKNGKQSSANK